MKWTLDHSRAPCFIRVVVEGKPSAKETLELWEQLLSCDEWRPDTSVLIDNTRLGAGWVNSENIDSLAKYLISKQRSIGDGLIAVLGSTADVNRYSRQLEYGLKLRGVAVLVRNFGDERAAIEWLTSHGASN